MYNCKFVTEGLGDLKSVHDCSTPPLCRVQNVTIQIVIIVVAAAAIIIIIIMLQPRARFHPQHSEKDAARAIVEVIETACLNFR